MRGICSPMGLAAVTGLSALLGIVLWPWGPIAVLYIAGRLHLNKAAALFVIALTMFPAVPALSLRLADHVLHLSAGPRLRWFVGSHIVAFTIAPALMVLVYLVARADEISMNIVDTIRDETRLLGERTAIVEGDHRSRMTSF